MSVQKVSISLGIAVLLILASTSASFANNGGDNKLELNAKLESRFEAHGDDDKNHDRNDDHSGRINWSFDPGIIGTVTAINGSTLNVKAGPNGSTYTVDASAVSMANIAVGDTVLVQGAINANAVVATNLIETNKGKAAIKSDLSGVVGRVTAVNGATITILGKNDVTYTINASNAKVWKNKNNSAKLSDIVVGDSIIVQGTVNGNNVTASNIIDVKLSTTTSGESMITGTVTAMSDTSMTVKGSNGTVYTVATANAHVVDHKDKEKDLDDIDVGDTVTIKGSIDGTNVSADMITEGNIRLNFFQRIGLFFKNMFGKRQ